MFNQIGSKRLERARRILIEELLRVGRLIDPANNIDDQLDLGIKEGRISFLAKSAKLSCAKRSFDARGKVVVPGLIDLHFHGYEHATPLGVPVDHIV